MPKEVIKAPETTEIKFNMSFVNLTQTNASTYPATTAIRIDYSTLTDRLTTYTIFDQYALRTKAIV